MKNAYTKSFHIPDVRWWPLLLLIGFSVQGAYAQQEDTTAVQQDTTQAEGAQADDAQDEGAQAEGAEETPAPVEEPVQQVEPEPELPPAQQASDDPNVIVEWAKRRNRSIAFNAYPSDDSTGDVAGIYLSLPVERNPAAPQAFLNKIGLIGNAIRPFKINVLGYPAQGTDGKLWLGTWQAFVETVTADSVFTASIGDNTVRFQRISDDLREVYAGRADYPSRTEPLLPHLRRGVLAIYGDSAEIFPRGLTEKWVTRNVLFGGVAIGSTGTRTVRFANLGRAPVTAHLRNGAAAWGDSVLARIAGPDSVVLSPYEARDIEFTLTPTVNQVSQVGAPINPFTVKYITDAADVADADDVALQFMGTVVKATTPNPLQPLADLIDDFLDGGVYGVILLLLIGGLLLVSAGMAGRETVRWAWNRQAARFDPKTCLKNTQKLRTTLRRRANKVKDSTADAFSNDDLKTFIKDLKPGTRHRDGTVLKPYIADLEYYRKELKTPQSDTYGMLDEKLGLVEKWLQDHPEPAPAPDPLIRFWTKLRAAMGPEPFDKAVYLERAKELKRDLIQADQAGSDVDLNDLTRRALKLLEPVEEELLRTGDVYHFNESAQRKTGAVKLSKELQYRMDSLAEDGLTNQADRIKLNAALARVIRWLEKAPPPGKQTPIEQQIDTARLVEKQKELDKKLEQLLQTLSEAVPGKISPEDIQNRNVTKAGEQVKEAIRTEKKAKEAAKRALQNERLSLKETFPKQTRSFDLETAMTDEVRRIHWKIKQELIDLDLGKQNAEAAQHRTKEAKDHVHQYWRPLTNLLSMNEAQIEDERENQQIVEELVENAPIIYSPDHLRDFRTMLDFVEPFFADLYRDTQAHNLSQFRDILKSVWQGERGNAGLNGADQRLSNTRLLKTLQQSGKFDASELDNVRKLKNVSPEAFYKAFIEPRFMPALDQIVRLYLLQQVPPEKLDMREILKLEEIDAEEIVSAYKLAVRVLKKHYGLTLRTVNLFEDTFNSDLHKKAYSDNEALTAVLPASTRAITALPTGVIYEIFKVGLVSEELGIDTKPQVIYKE